MRTVDYTGSYVMSLLQHSNSKGRPSTVDQSITLRRKCRSVNITRTSGLFRVALNTSQLPHPRRLKAIPC